MKHSPIVISTAFVILVTLAIIFFVRQSGDDKIIDECLHGSDSYLKSEKIMMITIKEHSFETEEESITLERTGFYHKCMSKYDSGLDTPANCTSGPISGNGFSEVVGMIEKLKLPAVDCNCIDENIDDGWQFTVILYTSDSSYKYYFSNVLIDELKAIKSVALQSTF